METFDLQILKQIEGKKSHRVEISNRFAALENLDTMHVNKVLETIREHIQIYRRERLLFSGLKNKPWFNEGCSKLLDLRKQRRFQWLQNPCEINGDNLNNIND
jgi:hypothetical protein